VHPAPAAGALSTSSIVFLLCCIWRRVLHAHVVTLMVVVVGGRDD
jgi:hypothetical protein